MNRGYKIPSQYLDDLCSRFILNVPGEYKDDIIRTFFHIEIAHWFYIDFHVPENPGLKIVGIKEFANQVFKHCPFLLPESDDVDALHQDWKVYKLSVPTYGVVLLDPTMTYALLVQGFSKSWGFPKGKMNEGEESVKCAIRELLEETGYDAGDKINASHYVEHSAGDQYCRLYIVPGIPLDTHFFPQTRNEIKAFQWFPLELLPTHKKDVSHIKELNVGGPSAFFMVTPFIKQIRRWISQKGSTYNQTTPKSVKKEKKTEGQIAFAQKSLKGFEEILHMGTSASTTSVSSEKPPGGARTIRGGGRNKVGGGSAGTRSPQYTLLQKDRTQENLKKVSKLRQNLGHIDMTEPKLPSSVIDDKPFKPCKEWATFRLDINACLKAAGIK